MLSQATLNKISTLENAYNEKTQQLNELNQQKYFFIPNYYFQFNYDQKINMSEALNEFKSEIEQHETENKNNFINAIKTLSDLFSEEQNQLDILNEKIDYISLDLESLKKQLQQLIYSEMPELNDLISVQFYKAYDENMNLDPEVSTIIKNLNPIIEEIVYNSRHKIVFKFEHRATSEELFSYFKSLVPDLDNNLKGRIAVERPVLNFDNYSKFIKIY